MLIESFYKTNYVSIICLQTPYERNMLFYMSYLIVFEFFPMSSGYCELLQFQFWLLCFLITNTKILLEISKNEEAKTTWYGNVITIRQGFKSRHLLIRGVAVLVRRLWGPLLANETFSSCRLSSSITRSFSRSVIAFPTSNICEIC